MHDIETPSPWMVRHAAYVKPRSELLDVACGKGRHARFFAARNVMVTAVDRDRVPRGGRQRRVRRAGLR